jgi:sterol desaturase/sphingolipid hydroxylase (fatty acid hydroxylase superfamily)
VHHSPERACTDSHYGNLLTAWDRLFRTRPAVPPTDQRAMAIGLETWRSDADQRWIALLLNPFRRPPRPEPTENAPHA